MMLEKKINNNKKESLFSNFFFLEPNIVDIEYIKGILRVPTSGDVLRKYSYIVDEIHKECLEKRNFRFLLDNKNAFQLSGVEISLQDIFNEFEKTQNWDTVLNYRILFEQQEIEINYEYILGRLKAKGDWHVIANNLNLFREKNIEIDFEELQVNLKVKNFWVSILNNYIEFLSEKNLDFQDLYDGLVSSNNVDLVLSYHNLFSQNGIKLDYKTIYNKLLSSRSYQTIIDYSVLFDKNNCAIDFGEIYSLVLKNNDWLTLVNNISFWSSYGFSLMSEDIFKRMKDLGEWECIMKLASFFIDNGIEFDLRETEKIFSSIEKISDIYLQQRYELIFLFAKYKLINISEKEKVNILNHLSDEGLVSKLNTASKILHIRPVESSEIIPPLNIENCKINEVMTLFYFYQLFDAELIKIKNITDYRYKIESEHLLFISQFEEKNKRYTEYVTKILREHLLFLIRDRIRRSKIENKCDFQLGSYINMCNSLTSDQIMDFFLGAIGASANANVATPWIQISYAGYNIWRLEKSSPVLVDYLFSLEHNNGSVFNRSSQIIYDDVLCRKLLDTKKESKDLDDYLELLCNIGIDLKSNTSINIRDLKMLGVIKERCIAAK